MKILTNNKKSKVVIVLAIIALLLGLGLGAVYSLKLWPFDSKKSSVPISSEQNKANNATNPDVKSTNLQSDTTSDKVPVSDNFTVKINTLEQDKDVVKFAGTVTGSSKPGTCVITFSNPNDKPVVRSYDSSTKDGQQICTEIDIPSLDFSYVGTWNVNFRFYSGEQQATIDDKIDIK